MMSTFKKELESEGQLDGVNFEDERTLYEPKFFDKIKVESSDNDNIDYDYMPRQLGIDNQYAYWYMRSTGEWTDIPKIFEDEYTLFK